MRNVAASSCSDWLELMFASSRGPRQREEGKLPQEFLFGTGLRETTPSPQRTSTASPPKLSAAPTGRSGRSRSPGRDRTPPSLSHLSARARASGEVRRRSPDDHLAGRSEHEDNGAPDGDENGRVAELLRATDAIAMEETMGSLRSEADDLRRELHRARREHLEDKVSTA